MTNNCAAASSHAQEQKNFLVDTHCHLNDEGMKDMSVRDMLVRAREAGVRYVVTINTRLDELPDLQNIVATHDHVFYTAGIHPHHADTYDPECFPIHDWMRDPKWIGLGETGLDYYYNNSPREQQQTSFRAHLAAAHTWGVPVVIHTRDADDDILAMVDEFPGIQGVFHCFSGSVDLARAVLERGFYLSFSGIITFKKADALRAIVASTPLDRILVETDAPYLAPVPFRGQTNEPMHTRIQAEHIAAIKGVSFEEVALATTRNFSRLFSRVALDDSVPWQ